MEEKAYCGNCGTEGTIFRTTRSDYANEIECKACGYCCVGEDMERLIKVFEEVKKDG